MHIAGSHPHHGLTGIPRRGDVVGDDVLAYAVGQRVVGRLRHLGGGRRLGRSLWRGGLGVSCLGGRLRRGLDGGGGRLRGCGGGLDRSGGGRLARDDDGSAASVRGRPGRFRVAPLAGADLEMGGLPRLDDRVRDPDGVELDRAGRIVVAGDHVVHPIRLVVGVHHPDNGNAELVRFAYRDLLVPHVDDVEDVGQGLGVLDAAEAALQLGEDPSKAERLLLAHALDAAVLLHRLHLPEPGDGRADGLEVREHAAEPALVHVGHAAPDRLAPDHLLGGALGADEEHRSVAGRHAAEKVDRLPVERKGHLEVDDVDAIALAEDVRCHLRVPVSRLVAEVHSGLQHVAHRDDGHRDSLSFGLCLHAPHAPTSFEAPGRT